MKIAASLAPLGECAVRIGLADAAGGTASAQARAFVRAVCERLAAKPPHGMLELVPAYAAVTVFYDPLRLARDGGEPSLAPYHSFSRELARIISELSEERPKDSLSGSPQAGKGIPGKPARIVEIPVCYGGDFGPDLAEVAAHAGLTPAEAAELHASADYEVAMIGFLPGFPYLAGLPRELAVPRLATPRRTVPAGAVAIGGEQTGIYPLASPGGWRIIGRTPLKLFAPERADPFLLRPGERVRFVPVAAERMAAEQGGGAS